MEFFCGLNIVWQTLILSFITFFLTALGAGTVFFFKKVNQRVINIMMSISAGIMLASAIFSLLIPSIEQSEVIYNNSYIVPCVGILAGGLFVVLVDKFLDFVLKNKNNFMDQTKKRQFLLMSAITFHNIPEGMCVGVAVASASMGLDGGIMSAILLAVGIGIQNFPEGASVSLPLLAEGEKKSKAFLWGSFSGIVEPIFAVLACLLSKFSMVLLPFLLAFSSGAMISVATTELISESAKDNKNLTTIFVLIGFCIMMLLDLMF